jgi:hypothetical protein
MNSSKNNKRGGYWNQSAPCTEEEVAGLMLANIKLLLQKKESDVESENRNNTELGDFGQYSKQLSSQPQYASAPPESESESSSRSQSARASAPLESLQRSSQRQQPPLASPAPAQTSQQASSPPPQAARPSQRQQPPLAPPPQEAQTDINNALTSALKQIPGLNLESEQLQSSITNVSVALTALSPKSSEQYDQVLQRINGLRESFLQQS